MTVFNITSNNLSELTEILKEQYLPNALEYYDNVTYNIRFYMLNHAFQKRFSNERTENNKDLGGFKIPDDEKIIIAETGISSSLSIDSLTLKTVHASIYKNPSAATYQMDLRIKEVNGCNLPNQIAVVSKMLGYESYITQPFHIDIWFSGYEQATGKPIKILKDGDKDIFFTYEVMCSEVITNVDNNGAIYNFNMVPVPQGSMDKSISTLFKIGEIKPSSNTFGGYLEKIVDLINEKYFEENPKIRNVFDSLNNGKREYLILNNFLYSDNSSYESLIVNDYFKNNKNLKNDIKNAPIEDFITPQNSDSIKEGYIQYDSLVTFEDMIQELCHHSPRLRNYIVRPRFRVKYLKNTDDGIECRQIFVDLIFTSNLYLEYFQKRGKVKNYTKEDDKKYIEEMQLEEIRNLILNKCVRKRYEWQYNGRDTSVIEFNSKLDKLWYANIGIDNVLTVGTSIYDNIRDSKSVEGKQILKSLYEDELIGVDKGLSLKEALKISNQPLSGIRPLAADKRIYLQDIYYCIDKEKIKEMDWDKRIIYEKGNPLANADNSDSSADTNVETILAKAGYENIHSAGNLVDLDLTILGDPFWLGIISDDELYKNNETINDFDRFFHFSFRVRSVLEQNIDGHWGDPNNIEDCMEFSNIYQIVESTSIFENGRFTQQLKGTINPAFIHLARMENL